MPLIQDAHDSLPYIDTAPAPSALEQANALIAAELSPEAAGGSSLHPALSAALQYKPKFSPLIELEHERLAKGEKPVFGLDLSRYEPLDAPEDPQQWRETLQKAYATSSYISGRSQNLALLEQYGKNAWLIGNAQLEDELRSLEREVKETEGLVEQVEGERRMAQEFRAGEVSNLEDSWRKGVGRMVETQVAAEGLQSEILQRRRAAAEEGQ